MNHSKTDHRTQAMHQSWCNKNGILIYPVAINTTGNLLKIEISRLGKPPQKGNEIYPNKTTAKQQSVYDKIRALYANYYTKNHK